MYNLVTNIFVDDSLHKEDPMKKKSLIYFSLSLLVLNMLLSGCASGQLLGPPFTPSPTVTYTPTLTPTSTQIITSTSTITLTPTITSTPTPATISFDLEGGGTYQMLRFDSIQEALNYITEQAVWYQGESNSSRASAMMSWNKTMDELTPEELAAYETIWKIPGLTPLTGLTFPQYESQFFNIYFSKLGNGTMLTFETEEMSKAFIYVDEDPESIQKKMGILSPDDTLKCLGDGGTFESCSEPSPELVVSTPTLLP
jgi:hypothetical protein